MTAKEYRYAIARLGLSQVASSKFLSVDPRTVRKWVAGERAIPEATALLLRQMVQRKIDPADVETTADATVMLLRMMAKMKIKPKDVV